MTMASSARGSYRLFEVDGIAVRPAFDLLGVSERDKRLVLFHTDHYVPKRDLIRESLDWLDKYLGPVKQRAQVQ